MYCLFSRPRENKKASVLLAYLTASPAQTRESAYSRLTLCTFFVFCQHLFNSFYFHRQPVDNHVPRLNQLQRQISPRCSDFPGHSTNRHPRENIRPAQYRPVRFRCPANRPFNLQVVFRACLRRDNRHFPLPCFAAIQPEHRAYVAACWVSYAPMAPLLKTDVDGILSCRDVAEVCQSIPPNENTELATRGIWFGTLATCLTSRGFGLPLLIPDISIRFLHPGSDLNRAG